MAATGALKSFLIVVNPVAGRGRAIRRARGVADVLARANVDVTLIETNKAGDAESFAKQAADEGIECVVACGGDGTVQQVVNGIVGSDCCLGIVPGGRCNDFATALGVPSDSHAAASRLLAGVARKVDLGRAGGRYFCTVAALGFDAAVSRYVNDSRLPLTGTPAYLFGVLRLLISPQPIEIQLEGDFGSFEGQVFISTTANTASYGGAIHIAPLACPYDGRLDLCVIDPISRLRALWLLAHVMRGSHDRLPEVRMLRSTKTEISSTNPAEIWADGEFMCSTPATIEAAPSAIRVVAERDRPRNEGD